MDRVRKMIKSKSFRIVAIYILVAVVIWIIFCIVKNPFHLPQNILPLILFLLALGLIISLIFIWFSKSSGNFETLLHRIFIPIFITIILFISGLIPVVVTNRSNQNGEVKEEKEENFIIPKMMTPNYKEFELVGIQNETLIRKIETITVYKYKLEDTNIKINLTYTGSINQNNSNNLFWYTGGNLLIEINGKECVIIDAILLNRTPSYGNDIDWVKNNIKLQIEASITNNLTLIVTKIKECLGL